MSSRITATLITLGLAAAPVLAIAGEPRLPATFPDGPISYQEVNVEPVSSTTGTCAAGGAQTPVDWEDYINPANGGDTYYTLVDPGTCTQCTATGTLTVQTVHVFLFFQTACTQPVLVSLVESKNDATCTEPDLERVLVPPTPYDFNAPGPGIFLFNLQLPTPVCLRGKAFLGIDFQAFGTACQEPLNPQIVSGDTLQCTSCRYYNYYLNNNVLVKKMLCNPSRGTIEPGPLTSYVNGSCCSQTPNLPATWGRLKMRYATPRRRRRRLPARARRPRLEG